MTFEHFAECVRDWQARYRPEDARKCIEGLWTMGIVVVPRETTLNQALAAIAKGESTVPAPVPAPTPARRRPRRKPVREVLSWKSDNTSPKVRTRALLRDQLKHGPKPAAQVEAAAQAADIPKHVLLAATDELGVRTRRGEWWLQG